MKTTKTTTVTRPKVFGLTELRPFANNKEEKNSLKTSNELW